MLKWRQLGALGLAGGARGVQQHRRVVGVGGGRLQHRLRGGQQRGEVVGPLGRAEVGRILAHDDQLLAARHPIEAGLGAVEETFPGDQRHGVRVLEVIGHLVAGQQHVERHHRCSQVVRPEVGDGELRHVRQHQRHVLTALDAKPLERPGKTLRVGVDRLVAEHRLADDQRGLLGVLLGAGTQDGRKIETHGAPSGPPDRLREECQGSGGDALAPQHTSPHRRFGMTGWPGGAPRMGLASSMRPWREQSEPGRPLGHKPGFDNVGQAP